MKLGTFSVSLAVKNIAASRVFHDTSGPASFTAVDPDGNQILIDQHR